jgi:hypothetical protein
VEEGPTTNLYTKSVHRINFFATTGGTEPFSSATFPFSPNVADRQLKSCFTNVNEPPAATYSRQPESSLNPKQQREGVAGRAKFTVSL